MPAKERETKMNHRIHATSIRTYVHTVAALACAAAAAFCAACCAAATVAIVLVVGAAAAAVETMGLSAAAAVRLKGLWLKGLTLKK